MTLTGPQVDAIYTESHRPEFHGQVREVRIQAIHERVLVTFDAGYGTYSFLVRPNGDVEQAGMGESA